MRGITHQQFDILEDAAEPPLDEDERAMVLEQGDGDRPLGYEEAALELQKRGLIVPDVVGQWVFYNITARGREALCLYLSLPWARRVG